MMLHTYTPSQKFDSISPINNQISYSFFPFRMNFLIFQNPSELLNSFSSKFHKNEGNVTNFGYVFITRLHVTLTNFVNGYSLYFVFLKAIFSKTSKKLIKIRIDSEKSISSFEVRKDNLIIYSTIIILLSNLVVNFLHYYCAK